MPHTLSLIYNRRYVTLSNDNVFTTRASVYLSLSLLYGAQQEDMQSYTHP